MGSFNETCALSGLAIKPGDPVKIMFLTRNPYAGRSDQKYAHRGCYHNDHWFLRTPPISGVYNDYGGAQFEESCLTRLIEDLFSKDVAEQPFGFNRYHAHPTPKKPTIHELLKLAWQGRILVKDDGSSSSVYKSLKQQQQKLGLPEEKKENYSHFPTWKKVLKLLKKAKLPTMSDQDKKGFNAQKVRNGVVVVNFNDYSENQSNLEKAAEVLGKKYDCRLVFKEYCRGSELQKSDPCLMVVAKGGFDDSSILLGPTLDNLKKQINKHPEHYNMAKLGRKLPVLAVMVRQDVWDIYCNVKYVHWHKDHDYSVDGISKKMEQFLQIPKQEYVDLGERPDLIKSLRKLKFYQLKELFVTIPFQTSLGEHVERACELLSEGKITEEDFKNLLLNCAEAIRVEYILGHSFQAWQIPIISGQESQFELKLAINKGVNQIIKNEIKKEKRQG